MPRQPLIVEDLSVHFGEHRVLDRLSFTLPPGRALALVGYEDEDD